MPKFFTYAEDGPAKFTGLSTGSWDTDVDLDLDATFVGDAPTIPATATGVILRFVNPVNDKEYAIGARHPDSATNRIDDLRSTIALGQVNSVVGINNNHEIDLYIESTNVSVYLIGYLTAESNFFSDANQYTYNPTSSGSWLTVDLSSYLSSGAEFAIFEVQSAANDGFAFRHPDSTDDRLAGSSAQHTWVVVPVDADRNIELKSDTTATDFYLIGEVTSNATVRTSGGDVSLSTTGSYQTIDMSSLSPPSGSVLAVVEVISPSTYSYGIRPYNDTSYTDVYSGLYKASEYMFIPIDSSDYAQGKISNVAVDFYVWGYITEESTQLPINLTGTITAATESDIVSGGKTIVLETDGDTWVSTVGGDNAITEALISGIDSAQSEAAGWDAVVKENMAYIDVVRTSDTVVTITLGAESAYSITANETITVTVPASALTGGVETEADNTFTITADSGFNPVWAMKCNNLLSGGFINV